MNPAAQLPPHAPTRQAAAFGFCVQNVSFGWLELLLVVLVVPSGFFVSFVVVVVHVEPLHVVLLVVVVFVVVVPVVAPVESLFVVLLELDEVEVLRVLEHL